MTPSLDPAFGSRLATLSWLLLLHNPGCVPAPDSGTGVEADRGAPGDGGRGGTAPDADSGTASAAPDGGAGSEGGGRTADTGDAGTHAGGGSDAGDSSDNDARGQSPGGEGERCDLHSHCSAGRDCCNDRCRSECPPDCGDGNLDEGEECDLGDANSNSHACKLDCTDQYCGDGHRGPSEQCDEGPQNSEAPGARCRTDCRARRCGDEIADPGEECDHGPGNSDTSPNACRTDCRVAACGDGQQDAGEACDDGNLFNLDGCNSNCEVSEYLSLPRAAQTSFGWVDVAVATHPGNATYAVDNLGMVHLSIDGGETLHPLCAASANGWNVIALSPAADGAAYVRGDYLYQIEPMAGGPCRRLPVGVDDDRLVDFAISPTSGDLHAWDESFRWSVSVDQGRTWDRRDHGMDATGSAYVNATIDPTDNHNVFVVRRGSGLFHRHGAGGVFGPVTTGVFSLADDRVGFDPLTTGLLYSNAGYVSGDGGATWTADGDYLMSGDWALDGAGRGYRLVAGASDTLLERAESMSAPVWTPLASFPGGSQGDRVSAFGNTVAVVVSQTLHVSLDDGQDFQAVSRLTPFRPVTVASPDGQTFYAGTSDWTFYRSRDAGASWTFAYQAADVRKDPEIFVNPADPRHVFVQPTGTSVYERQILVSHDGLDSVVASDDGVYGWATTAAHSLTNPSLLYHIGWTDARRSLDGGDSFSALVGQFPLVWYPSRAFVNPLDDDIMWVAAQGSLYEYDHAAGTFLDVAGRLGTSLGEDQVAALLVIEQAADSYDVLAIGRQGQVAVSDDLTQSFSHVGDASSGSCNSWRLLEAAPGNHSLVATACYDSSSGAAVSTDGGVTWMDVTDTPDWSHHGCRVMDLAMTELAAIFACEGSQAVLVPLAAPICGNGRVELPESCDDGLANSDAPNSHCRLDCTLGRCGDGIVDDTEQCDDGNDDDRDGCTSYCSLCGDGRVTAPEQCDEGPQNSAMYDASCRLDCRKSRCGDGVQSVDEVCDDGNAVGDDGCRSDCMGLEACGDGLVDHDAGEECDLGGANSDLEVDGCRSDCRAAHCGDGVVDTGERCEGGAECSVNCLEDYAVEPLCDGINDDDDQTVDEGCAGAPPSPPILGWVEYPFAFYDYKIGCDGARYASETGYSSAPFVGVILCSDSRYKILLSESLDGIFYSIGDGAGSGQDHCEFVGGTHSAMDSGNNGGQPGFTRAGEGDEPSFGTMNGAHYTATWHECGVTIP